MDMVHWIYDREIVNFGSDLFSLRAACILQSLHILIVVK